MPKKVLVAMSPGMLEQIDHIAQVEHRTRSDLIREGLRRYIENFKRCNNTAFLPAFERTGSSGTPPDTRGTSFDTKATAAKRPSNDDPGYQRNWRSDRSD